MVVEVVERLIDATGQPLLIPDLEVSTGWTNLSEYEATRIHLYRNHATREQYHSELKSDMGIERLHRQCKPDMLARSRSRNPAKE